MSVDLLKNKYEPYRKIEPFFSERGIQITEDGEYLFCQCSDCVNIVLISSGCVIRKIQFDADEVSSIALSPNGLALAVGFTSSSVKHYEVKDVSESEPSLVASFRSYHRGPVLAMTWDSSSTLLATASSDGSARVWDLKQKFCTHSLKEASGVVRVLAFDANLRDRPWVFGAAEEHIYVWELGAGLSSLVAKLEGHNSAVTGVQLTPDRQELVSCGLDKVVIVWDLKKFASKRIIPMFESLPGLVLKPPQSRWFHVPDDSEENVIFTVGDSAKPRLWNVDRGKEIWKSSSPIVPETEKEEVLLFSAVHYCKSLNSVLIVTYDHNILFVRCDTMSQEKQLVGHNDEIVDAILVGSDLTHTAVASNSCQIRLYHNSSLSCELVSGHTAAVISLAENPADRTIFASSSHDNSVRVWKVSDTASVSCLALATGHTNSVGCVVFAKEFLVSGSRDTCIKTWDFICSGSDARGGGVGGPRKLTSRRTQKAHEKDINGVAVSPNFKYVASASLDHTAKLWDAQSLNHLGSFGGHKKGVWGVQFSPSDCLLATCSSDATIKIWNITQFTNVATLEGHEVGVLKVCWVSRGLQLLSGSSDGLLKLWTLRDNVCVDTFDEHDGKLWALHCVRDGREAVTGGADSKLVWWRDVTAEHKQKQVEDARKLVEQEQQLSNLVHERKWAKALRLSIRLDQPFRSLNITKELLDTSPGDLTPVLKRLGRRELSSLLDFVVQWNTKTKNMREAQSVVAFLLNEMLPEELEEMPGWSRALEGLLPFTERHMSRVAALHQSASIVHFVSSCLSVADADGDMVDLTCDSDILKSIPKVHLRDSFIYNDSGMEVSEGDEADPPSTSTRPDPDLTSPSTSDSDSAGGGSESDSEGDAVGAVFPEDLRSDTFKIEEVVASSSSEAEDSD